MTRLKRRKELPAKTRDDLRFGTPGMVAEHRAKRLAKLSPDTIVDVGAGAGFQTQAFSRIAKHVIALDIDKERLERASISPNVTAIVGDALSYDVFDDIKKHCEGKAIVFLDPERPPSSAHRTLAEIRPDIKEFLRIYSPITADIAIELPPFIVKEELEQITLPFEREYLSIDGKLNRLTLYFGGLKSCDASVVRLPQGSRVEAGTPCVPRAESVARPQFLLEPDAALSHAGLEGEALRRAGDPAVELVGIGNKVVLLTQGPVSSPFFKEYKILMAGPRKSIELALRHTGALILHGKLDQDEQRQLLQELRPYCRGGKRTHLFLGRQWYLCIQTAQR